MNNLSDKNSIKERILGEIKEGQIKMRPRWRFALEAFLILAGGVIILLALLYLASFVIFVLRETGVLFVPVFGLDGWQAFFFSLPWILIFFILVFAGVLELLIRRYSFIYRRPLVYSALGIIFIVAAGGIFVANTSLHEGLSGCADKNSLPLMGPVYHEYANQRLLNIHRGRIMNLVRNNAIINNMIIQNRQSERYLIIVTPKTRLPLGADFSEGDTVIIFGGSIDNTITALGIQEVEISRYDGFCR